MFNSSRMPGRRSTPPTLLAAGVIAFVLAGCGGSTPGTVSPTTTSSATTTTGAQTATPSAAATGTVGQQSPTGAATATASAIASPGATLSGDLESIMPTVIDGVPMTIEPASDSASSFLNLWNDEQIARNLLTALGKAEGDIDVVFSYSEPDVPQINLTAYRIAGVDAEALKDGMVANYFAFFEDSGGVVTETTLGGKNVAVLSLPNSAPGVGEHFYAVGDIVFTLSADPPEWVAKTLAVLP